MTATMTAIDLTMGMSGPETHGVCLRVCGRRFGWVGFQNRVPETVALEGLMTVNRKRSQWGYKCVDGGDGRVSRDPCPYTEGLERTTEGNQTFCSSLQISLPFCPGSRSPAPVATPVHDHGLLRQLQGHGVYEFLVLVPRREPRLRLLRVLHDHDVVPLVESECDLQDGS